MPKVNITWFLLRIEPRSQNLHPTSSTNRPRTPACTHFFNDLPYQVYYFSSLYTNKQYSYRDTSTSTKSRMVETNPGCPDACYHQNRPEEFYDLFLASSVLKSDEYKQLVEERKRRRKSEEQVGFNFLLSVAC